MNFDVILKQSGPVWVNAENETVPVAYVNPLQKMEERKVHAIYSVAKTALEQLRNKKQAMKKHADELIAFYFKHNGVTTNQESFTFYNFNKSVMVEVEKVQPLAYDQEMISEASSHFQAYLDANLGEIDDAVKKLIEDMVLSVNRKRMNVTTVKKLESIGRSIDDEQMKKALELITNAQGKGSLKVYYRVRLKNPETEEYDLLDLNFSSIEI